MLAKIIGVLRFVFNYLMGPAYKVVIFPQKIILFPKNGASLLFRDLDSLVVYLKDKKRIFSVYVEGFTQDLLVEKLPALKAMEQRSYIRHKVSLFLEKIPLVFVQKSSAEVTYLSQKMTFLDCFKEISSYFQGLRSLALECASLFEEPTLCRFPLSEEKEVLIYTANRTLYFIRTIQRREVDAYEKTLRYIERQYQQPEENLAVQNWTLDELMDITKGNIFKGGNYYTPRPINRLYFLSLALKGFVAFMVGISLFLAAGLADDWQEKEKAQQLLFSLKNDIQKMPASQNYPVFPLSLEALEHFEEVTQTRKSPFDALKLLIPLNAEETSMKGLLWRHGHEEKKVQVVFEICSSGMPKSALNSWVQDRLLSYSSFLNITSRDEDTEDLVWEEETEKDEMKSSCLVFDVAFFDSRRAFDVKREKAKE